MVKEIIIIIIIIINQKACNSNSSSRSSSKRSSGSTFVLHKNILSLTQRISYCRKLSITAHSRRHSKGFGSIPMTLLIQFVPYNYHHHPITVTFLRLYSY